MPSTRRLPPGTAATTRHPKYSPQPVVPPLRIGRSKDSANEKRAVRARFRGCVGGPGSTVTTAATQQTHPRRNKSPNGLADNFYTASRRRITHGTLSQTGRTHHLL